MWRIAKGLFDDHAPGADDRCSLCRPADLGPCPARQLAVVGLQTAFRQPGELDSAGRAWFDVLRRRVAVGALNPVVVPAESMWAQYQPWVISATTPQPSTDLGPGRPYLLPTVIE